MIPQPPTPEAWTAEIRQATITSIRIAADAHDKAVAEARRVLSYYLRTAIAHGATRTEIAGHTGLEPALIDELTDPHGAL